MRDIVEELRKAADQCESTETSRLVIEAADAIERQRDGLLEEILTLTTASCGQRRRALSDERDVMRTEFGACD